MLSTSLCAAAQMMGTLLCSSSQFRVWELPGTTAFLFSSPFLRDVMNGSIQKHRASPFPLHQSKNDSLSHTRRILQPLLWPVVGMEWDLSDNRAGDAGACRLLFHCCCLSIETSSFSSKPCRNSTGAHVETRMTMIMTASTTATSSWRYLMPPSFL